MNKNEIKSRKFQTTKVLKKKSRGMLERQNWKKTRIGKPKFEDNLQSYGLHFLKTPSALGGKGLDNSNWRTLQ